MQEWTRKCQGGAQCDQKGKLDSTQQCSSDFKGDPGQEETQHPGQRRNRDSGPREKHPAEIALTFLDPIQTVQLETAPKVKIDPEQLIKNIIR